LRLAIEGVRDVVVLPNEQDIKDPRLNARK
jgi:hypothetical protein